jgi:hypothetical protein
MTSTDNLNNDIKNALKEINDSTKKITEYTYNLESLFDIYIAMNTDDKTKININDLHEYCLLYITKILSNIFGQIKHSSKTAQLISNDVILLKKTFDDIKSSKCDHIDILANIVKYLNTNILNHQEIYKLLNYLSSHNKKCEKVISKNNIPMTYFEKVENTQMLLSISERYLLLINLLSVKLNCIGTSKNYDNYINIVKTIIGYVESVISVIYHCDILFFINHVDRTPIYETISDKDLQKVFERQYIFYVYINETFLDNKINLDSIKSIMNYKGNFVGLMNKYFLECLALNGIIGTAILRNKDLIESKFNNITISYNRCLFELVLYYESQTKKH